MRALPQISILNEEKNEPHWLRKEYDKRENRSIGLGKEAIDRLVREKKDVTYNNISKKSKELDPQSKGIHPNTISRNEELYEYYKKHSKTYAKKKTLEKRRKVQNKQPHLNNFDYIKLDRNKADVRKRYNRLTKKELINRLIECEEYIARQNNLWLVEKFEEVNYE